MFIRTAHRNSRVAKLMARAGEIRPDDARKHPRSSGIRSLVLSGIVLTGTVFAPTEAIRAQSTAERQAACELSAIRDTRSAVAIQLIRSACNWLALNADSLLNERNKNYYICLVQNLSGSQADAAAQAVASACRTANPL
jgi:hypothetical protein